MQILKCFLFYTIDIILLQVATEDLKILLLSTSGIFNNEKNQEKWKKITFTVAESPQ
jgi:hypothetical protein